MNIKTLSLAILATLLTTVSANETYFTRSASFLSCTHFALDCNDSMLTSAETLYIDKSGNTLVYTDNLGKSLGVVDVSDLNNPIAKNLITLGGEPTSVTVKGDYALVSVNTSKNYIDVSGEVQVYDLKTMKQVTSIDLGGQPDSIAISPDQNYAIIAIENERNENKNSGILPQAPAGFAMILDTQNTNPEQWKIKKIDLVGLADIAGDDPEPEYVDINADNIAVITLQENNHIVLVDLEKAEVIKHFSAGTVDLKNIDLTEGRPKQISMTESKDNVAREPDGVSWIDSEHFATANEGAWKGGSRGFTIFNKTGEVVWDSGNTLAHFSVSVGHYPDKRSGNKGVEPENIEVATFNGERLLFVNTERASLVFVYNIDNVKNPVLKQVLPTGFGPEGAIAVPSQNALFVASEIDYRKRKIRSGVNLYQFGAEYPTYPTLQSVQKNGLPIAWSTLSGLAADSKNEGILYSIEDNFYKSNRIFKIDARKQPAKIVEAMAIKDNKDLLVNINVRKKFSLVNDDKTVNIDPEGIAVSADGGFWIASEGSGTMGDNKKPFNYPNLLLKTDKNGGIAEVITLPDALNKNQLCFGFKGVAEQDGKVYVVFQRPWKINGKLEADPRIGIYNPINKSWQFIYYPIGNPTSPFGGWVGVSAISPIGDGKFYVLERDSQSGLDARIKRIYRIDLNYIDADKTVKKTLVRNLMTDLAKTGGFIPEKIDGLTVTPKGEIYIVNDNDGLKNNSGETQLINLK